MDKRSWNRRYKCNWSCIVLVLRVHLSMDFDTAMLRNPNGQNGLLRAITSTTAATQIDCIGHYIQASQ